MSFKSRILSALWLLTSATAQAQHWSFQTYGPDAGLTNPTILALHQDHEGFLWVSTEGGLFRYDGDRFHAFEVRLPGKAGLVACLHSSPDGQLWAASIAGLFRWAGDHFTPVPGFANVDFDSKQAIASDATHLYLASSTGIWSWPLAGGRSPVRLTSIRSASVFVSRNDTVWYGCGTGLCTLHASRKSEQVGELSGPWNSIAEDSTGRLWIRSAERVMVGDEAGRSFREIARLPSSHGARLLATKKGQMLVPHNAGLAICDARSCRNFGPESGLHNAELVAVHEDREGSIWLGYSGHGLTRWLGREEWQNFAELEGLTGAQIWRIARARSGELWIGTNRGLFHGSEQGGNWAFHRSDVLGEWSVYGLLADPDGSLWLGTYQPGLHGLIHYDPSTGQRTVYPPANPRLLLAINNISRDPTGAIWIATPNGILRLRPGAQQLEPVNLPGSAGPIFQILHSRGAMYIAGRRGLYIERAGIGRLFTVADGLKDNAVQSVAVGPKGELWIAYYAAIGISRLAWPDGNQPGGKIQLRHFSLAEGLPTSVVYSQFFDARGRHWIGTDNGVAVFDGRKWVRYDTSDGMVWNDCNAASYLVDPNDGAVWIGTSAGMSRFLPVPHQPPPLPLTLITAVTRNGSPAVGDIFDSATQTLALRFTMLAYRRDRPLFRYRLGQNGPWIETQAREVQFAELPAGAYHFEVQGEIDPGSWSRPATRDFKIKPPWFLARPVRFGAPFLLVALSWLGWRRRERVLRKIRENLEAAVTERTRSLAAATARAEQESRFKGEFLANMSHEMRTPLNGVIGITRLALELSNQPEVIRHLTTVQFSAKLLLTLVNDVLDLAKIEAGMFSIVPVTFAPRLLLEEIRLMLEAEALSKGLWLNVDVHNSVPKWLQADDSRLRQIIVNLVGNALKFTEAGSVLVTIRHTGAKLQCEVADSGIGIEPEHREMIFEVFRQADGSTSRRYGGSGLGLSISRKLVESMGGSIGVESEPGRGSRFFFDILAAVAAAPVPQPAASLPAAPVGRALRILVADDNKINQHLLVSLLKKKGHTIVLADDGQEALSAFAREHFDLILMDIQMPRMDGLEAVRLIRQAEVGSGNRVLIVAVTARCMAGDRAEILAAGMDDYLAKPIQMERLTAILRALQHTPETSHSLS